MLTVAVMLARKFRGREKLPPYITRGIEKCGDKAIEVSVTRYREPISDVAIFYGFDGRRESELFKIFTDYKAAGLKAIYVDLGYLTLRETWSHTDRSWYASEKEYRYSDYHRFSINDRHPTADFQRVKHPSDRFEMHGRTIEKWGNKRGNYILLCGMSEKCAVFEGFQFEEWERAAIKTLREHTDRPILYRPKPQRRRLGQRGPIKGVEYSDPLSPFPNALRGAWAVVSHHSNAGIHAIRYGVPCFQDEGVASVMGYSDLSLIESPKIPSDEERRQFLFDVAYWQYRREEMAEGKMWKMLKDEGLV